MFKGILPSCWIWLDKSYHQIARDVISLSEKLKATYESLTFLQRCKRNYLVLDCVSQCFDTSLNIKNSASLNQFLTKSKRNLLSILIRSKYSENNDINRCLKERKSRLSEWELNSCPSSLWQRKRLKKDQRELPSTSSTNWKMYGELPEGTHPRCPARHPTTAKQPTTLQIVWLWSVTSRLQNQHFRLLQKDLSLPFHLTSYVKYSNTQCKLKWLLWRMLWDGKVPTHCQHKISSPPQLPWPRRHYQRAPSTVTGKSHPVTTQSWKRRSKIYERTYSGSWRGVMFT